MRNPAASCHNVGSSRFFHLSMKHLATLADITTEQLIRILDLAEKLQQQKEKHGFLQPLLKGATIALTFEKPSLRTRAAFDIAAADLGAHPIFFGPDEIFLSSDGTDRETIEDIVRNVERFSDLIVARVFKHKTIQKMAAISRVPVINALCDRHHPTQAICDLYAIRKHFGKFTGLKVAWIGDGDNVAASLAQACRLVGMRFAISTPNGYGLPDDILAGSDLMTTCDNPLEAVIDADIVATDTWISMGLEHEKDERDRVFQPFRVTPEIMSHAKKSAIFMHCLPAYRGEEVAAEVIDGPQSIVFDEAISRLYIARALLILLINRELG